METNALFVLAVFIAMLAIIVVSMWPSLGILMLLSIILVKLLLRFYMPFLVSYTYDMGVVMIALIGAVIHRLRHPKQIKFSMPTGFWMCWGVLVLLHWLRLPGSREMQWGYEKSLIFTVFNTSVLIVLATYVVSLKEVKRILMIVVLLAAINVVCLLQYGVGMDRWEGARMTFGGANPLVLADLCALGVVVIATVWLAQRKIWQLLLFVVGTPVLLYAIIMTGTRSPVIALPIVLLVVVILYMELKNAVALALALLVIVAVGFFITQIVDETMLRRFNIESMGAGAAVRKYMIGTAVQGFLGSPFWGTGTGDMKYQLVSDGFFGMRYPHNHVAEVANEFGIIGLLPYLILVGYGFRSGWRLFRAKSFMDPQLRMVGVCAFGCYVSMFLTTMKAGTFSSGAITYFFLGLTVVTSDLAVRYSLTGDYEETYEDIPIPDQCSADLVDCW